MNTASGLTPTHNRRMLREDTVNDAKFFELAIETPLVFAAQNERISPVKEEQSTTTTFSDTRSDFPGPQRWEEGYQNELKNEADRILRNFVKTPDDREFESTSTVALLEDNLTDRLGRGYLDPNSLRLISEQALPTAANTMRRSLGAAQFARITNRMGFRARLNDRSREERRRQELRDKILPSSSNFSPEFYLSHVHADTTLDELHEGMHYLEEELSKRTGQLKTLVREHFEGFISCKNSIDDVHVRLRRNEAQNSGANTGSLKASLTTVQKELKNSFAPILERHAKLEQLKHVMEILKRFQSSFNLPSNIRQLSENRDFPQVVTEYRRAKSTMAGADVAIWRSLFEEVNKETTDVCTKMHKTLEDPLLEADQVQELVLCICQLRNEGLEFAFTLEPMLTWLSHVESYVHMVLDRLAAKHRQRIEETSEEFQKAKKRTLTNPFDSAPVHCSPPSTVEHCAKYIIRLCRLMVDHLPKLWTLKENPNLRAMADVDEEIRQEICKELDQVDGILQGIFDNFSKRIVETMENLLISEGLLSPCVFVALKELRIFAADMKGCPESFMETVLDLIHECFEMCVNYLCTYLRQQMASLGEWEDWEIRIGSYRRGHPVTSVPYKLGQAVRDVMEQFRLIKAEQDPWLDGHRPAESKSLNQAFTECFESFAMAVEGLAAETVEPRDRTQRQGPQMEISKLLILMSNSMYIRQRIVPDLIAEYTDFIIRREDLSDDTIVVQFRRLEDTMLQAYIEHVKKLLEKSVDATIAMEKETPPSRLTYFKASESSFEWISIMSDIHAELLKFAPSKCDDVISTMALHLVKRIKLRIQDLPHLGYLLQMYIDAMTIENILKGMDLREIRRAWDMVYDRLNHLIRAQICNMKDSDHTEVFGDDAGMNMVNAFTESDTEDVIKLDKKLQKMFKDGVRDGIKSRSIHLAALRAYKLKDKEKAKPTARP